MKRLRKTREVSGCTIATITLHLTKKFGTFYLLSLFTPCFLQDYTFKLPCMGHNPSVLYKLHSKSVNVKLDFSGWLNVCVCLSHVRVQD